MGTFDRTAKPGRESTTAAVAVATLVAAVSACGDSGGGSAGPNRTLFDAVADRPDLATLASLVQAAGMEAELSDPSSELTLLAPTNSAFEELPAELLTFLEANPSALADVLRHHIVLEPRALTAFNTIDDESLPTAEGSAISTVSSPPRTILVEDASGSVHELVDGDISAGLSVVHLVDGVLLPREIEIEPPPGNLVEVAQGREDLTQLVAGAIELEVDGRAWAELLSDPEPQTLFAPTDAAFGDLGLDLESVTNDSDLGDVVTNVLMAHVARGDSSFTALAASSEVETRARLAFDVLPESEDMPALVGGAAVAETDIEASNGRLHVLDEVIVPPTILDVATATPGLSTLANALDAAPSELRDELSPDVLSGETPVTVIAPDDQAFSEANLDGEEIGRALRYHVIEGQLTADDLVGTPDGTELETLSGEALTVSNDGVEVRLVDGRGNSVGLVASDVRALDGIIHIVDGVLQPPETSAPDVLGAALRLTNADNGLELGTVLLATSTLELEGTAIANLLATPGPFTLFAPTDAAFADLGLDLTDLNEDDDLRAVVSNVLLTHIAEGSRSAADLASDPIVRTLGRTAIVFNGRVEPPIIGGATIRRADISASNGILHVLDDVIIPATVRELIAGTSTLSQLSTLVDGAEAAVQGALEPDVLSGDAPITVFAPPNAAFEAAELEEENLDDVLAFHALAGQLTADELRELADGATLQTIQGGLLTVRNEGAIIELEDGRGRTIQVLDADIRGLNGIVHGTDRVMLPPTMP